MEAEFRDRYIPEKFPNKTSLNPIVYESVLRTIEKHPLVLMVDVSDVVEEVYREVNGESFEYRITGNNPLATERIGTSDPAKITKRKTTGLITEVLKEIYGCDVIELKHVPFGPRKNTYTKGIAYFHPNNREAVVDTIKRITCFDKETKSGVAYTLNFGLLE